MGSRLREAVQHLASTNMGLRAHLLHILSVDSRTSSAISSRAQSGFDSEFRSELDRLFAGGVSRTRVSAWGVERLREAFTSKDSLYLALIVHQPTYESEAQFLAGLFGAVRQWERELV